MCNLFWLTDEEDQKSVRRSFFPMTRMTLPQPFLPECRGRPRPMTGVS